MKKVLALVLAVIMVCTMAMANVNINASTPVVVIAGSAGSAATIKLDPNTVTDFTKTYVMEVPAAYFNDAKAVLGLTSSPKTNKELFTVVGPKGAWAIDANTYTLVIPVADKALDKVADYTIDALTIKVDANNYVDFAAKDGKLVVKKVVKGGLNVATTSVTANALDTAYDIGFEAATTFNAANQGWYYTENGLDKEPVTANMTLTVPAKTYFKYTLNDVVTPKISTNNTATASYLGATVTAGTLTMEIAGDKDTILYAMDKNGKLFVNPSKLVVTADANGVETGKWTVSGNSLKSMVSVTKAETNVAGSTTGTDTTTNPGTGANDVVGVAAALAVVALVSGAAISLKK